MLPALRKTLKRVCQVSHRAAFAAPHDVSTSNTADAQSKAAPVMVVDIFFEKSCFFLWVFYRCFGHGVKSFGRSLSSSPGERFKNCLINILFR